MNTSAKIEHRYDLSGECIAPCCNSASFLYPENTEGQPWPELLAAAQTVACMALLHPELPEDIAVDRQEFDRLCRAVEAVVALGGVR